MNLLAAGPPILRWLLLGTAAVWMVRELRQSLAHRPEALKANWGSEILFRFAVGAGAVAADLFPHLAPAATIRPALVAAWVGLVLFGCGIASALVELPYAGPVLHLHRPDEL